MRFSRRPSFVLAASIAAVLLPIVSHAQTVWSGLGTDDDWGTGANWVGGNPPPTGSTSDLTFTGTTRLTPNNNYTAFDDFRNILFDANAGAFTLGGAAIDLFGKIENLSTATQTISLASIALNSATANEFNPINGNLIVTSADIFTNGNVLNVWGDNGRTLTITGNIQGVGGTGAGILQINQNSTVVLAGVSQYSGETRIHAGQLEIAATGGLNSASNIFVGNGAAVGNAATLLLTDADGGTVLSNAITINPGSGLNRTVGGTNASGTNTFLGNLSLDGVFGQDRSVRLTANAGGTVEFSGVISGAGQAVAKIGNGTVVLSGANTFGGIGTVVAIDAGTLSVGADANLGDAANSVAFSGTSGVLATSATFSTARNLSVGAGAGTLSVGTGTTLTLGGTVSGAGTFNKAGAGALLLNGASAAGAVNVQAGTLALGAADRLADASALTVSGGTFDVAAFSDTVDTVTLTGGSINGAGTLTATNGFDVRAGSASAILAGGALTKNGVGTVNLTGVNTFTGTVTIIGGLLGANADAALGNAANAITLAGGGLNATTTFTTTRSVTLDNVAGNSLSADSGQTLTLDTALTGTGGFAKAGAGTVSLIGSGVNTFAGAVAVNLGVLELNKTGGNAIPNVPVTLTSNTPGQAIIRLQASEQIHDSAPISFSIGGGQSATLDLNGFTETVGAITISTASTGTNPGGVNGVRTGAGGTLILNGDLTFNHNRNAGGNTGRELLLTATGTYGTTVSGGGTLDLGGGARTITVNTSHTQTGNNAHIDLNIVNGGIVKEGTRLLVLNGSASTFTGGITINAGAVTLTNTSATNTFSGGFTLNSGGTLQANAAGGDSTAFNQQFGAAGNSFVFNGGTFQANYGANDRTMTGRTFTVGAGGGTFNVGGTYTNFVDSGQTQLRLSHATASVFSGSGALTKIGGGRLTLNNNSPSFSGAWIVNNGTLEAGALGRLGDGSATNTVTVSGGNVALGIASYPNNITLSGGGVSSITNTTVGITTLAGTVAVSSASHLFLNDFFQDTGVAKTMAVAGVLSGSAPLNVEVSRAGTNNNSGTLILQNAGNTYSGTVSVGKNLRLQANSSTGTGNPLNTAAVTLAGGHLQLRDNGTGSNGTLTYGNNVTLTTPTGLLNNGNIAGTPTINVDRSSGANVANTIQLGTLTFDPGVSTLDVTGGNGYQAEFTGATTLSGSTTFNATTGDLKLNDINGAGFTITKTGAGRLTIAGTNNTDPAVALNGGTLQYNSAASIAGSGATITAANGTAVAAGYAIDQAFLGRIVAGSNSHVIALAADSANNLNLTSFTAARLGAAGAATFSGTLTPAGSTYRLGGGTPGHVLTISGTNALTGAATLDIGTNGTGAGTVALTGSNDFTGAINLSGGGEVLRPSSNASLGNAANAIAADGGGIQFAAGSAFDIFAARTITFGAGGFILDTNGNDHTPSVAISGNAGTGSFTKAGAGTLTLAQTSTYSGATNVAGGVLAIADPALLGTTSGIGGQGGTLRFTGTGAATLGKTVALSATTGALTIDVPNASANLTSSLVISGGPAAGNLALTKSGAGTLTMVTAVNTFTGDIAVTGGTLATTGQGNVDPTFLGGGAKAVTLTNGATFRVTSGDFNPASGTKRLVMGAGGGIFNSAGATGITLDDASQFSGAGDLLVAGGVVNLGNAYVAYTGDITIGAGARLRAFNGNANPLGDAVGTTTVLPGGALDIQSTGTNNEPVFISGMGINNGGALINSGTNSSVLDGPVTLTGAASVGGGSTGTLTVRNAVAGGFALTKVGTATFALGGANGVATAIPALTLNAGTFLLNNDGGADVTSAENENRLADNVAINFAGSGVLELRGLNRTAADTTTETVGTIAIDGGGTVRVGSATPAFTTTTLNATLGARSNGGVLFVDPTATAGAALGASSRFVVTNAPAVLNGGTMVAPYFQNPTTGSFLTYGANGFADAAFTSTDLNTATATSIVDQGATAVALSGNTTVFAAKLGTGAVTGNTLILASGGLILAGAATHTSNFAFNDGTQNVEAIVTATATASLTGNIAASSFTKAGSGTLTLNTAAATTYTTLATTPINVLGGNLSIAGAGANTNNNFLGPVQVAAGATFSQPNVTNTNALVIGGLSGAGTVTAGSANTGGVGNLIVNQNTDSSFTGQITNNSRLNIVKRGAADLTLTNATNASDGIQADFGELILSGNWNNPSTNATRKRFVVGQGGTMTMDNTGTNNLDRILLTYGSDGTGGVVMAINGGTFNFLGNSSAASSETLMTHTNAFGTPTFGAGRDVFNIEAGSGQSSLVHFSLAFTRSAGASVLVRGTNLGGAQGGANVATLRYGAAPTAANFVGGGGAVGTTTRNVIKGVIADSVIGGVDTLGLSTYDPGANGTFGDADDLGVRRLLASELAANITDGSAVLDNVRLTGASNAITSPTTINALHLDAGASIDGSGTLTIGSGTILAAGGANAGIGTTTPGTLAFGTSEAIVHAESNLTIASAVSGSGGLTKGGAGTLTLTTDNTATLTGGQGITVNAGLVSVANGTALGPASNVLRLNNGGGLQGTATFSTSRNVVLGNAGGRVDVVNAGDTVTISGAISGNLGTIVASTGIATNTGTRPIDTTVLTKTGTGTLLLTGTNTFTGRTEVNAGTLLVGNSAGAGTLPAESHVAVNNGGTLGGSGSIGGSVVVNSGGTLAPGNSAGQIDTGSLTLGSGSTLSLEVGGLTAGTDYDQVNVTGSILLNGGSLTLDLTGAFTPTEGDLFFIALNDGVDAVTGTFAGLGQGALFTADSQQWLISYTGDSAGSAFTGGNDIVLQAVPEPGSAATLLAGLGMLCGLQRFRRRREQSV